MVGKVIERWYYASSSTGTAKKLKTAHQKSKVYGWIKTNKAEKIVESSPSKGIRIRNPGNFCLWNVESGIRGFGIRNTTQGIRNSGFWNAEYSSMYPKAH